MRTPQKGTTIVHYFACRAREEPIISVSLLSGVLWDELKCEFNLLGAKVNFRRGISRCAPWGVYTTLPLRDVLVGPQPQISVWQPATALWCGGIDTHSLCPPPPHPALTSLLALPAAGALPEAPLITSTLLCNHPHRPDCPSNANIRQIEQEAAAYIKAGPGSQVCQYWLLIKSRFKTRLVLKIHSSFWPMFTNPPLIETSPVCPTLVLLSAVTHVRSVEKIRGW